MQRRDFIKVLGLGSTLLPLMSCAASSAPLSAQAGGTAASRIKPKGLQVGDTVGLVSPSAASSERLDYQLAAEAMVALGLKVKTGQHLMDRRGHLAGEDKARAADVNQMFADPEVKAVICLRGGSGAARILPLLDYDLIRRNPKPLVGYSDITALHNALLAKSGLISFHGANGTATWNEFTVRQFKQLFFARELPVYRNEPEEKDELVPRKNRIQTITAGTVSGELVGGNLTVLTALAGSPYLPDFTDKILFLEDVEEEPYRVDRMLSTLRLMGALDKIKGFVFGECTDCEPSGGYGALTLDQIFDDYIKPLNIPAYRGAMIGHIPRQFLLPVGGKVELNADTGEMRLLESVFS